MRWIRFQWTWVWRRSVNFSFGFSLQGFCVLCIILSEFLTKDVLEGIVNPIYLIRCCDFTLIKLVLKTIVLIFNTTHKVRCCKYWYCLVWYKTNLFFWREMHLRKLLFYYLFIYFFCFLCYIFDIYITQILLSNKTWLSELFSILSRYKYAFTSG